MLHLFKKLQIFSIFTYMLCNNIVSANNNIELTDLDGNPHWVSHQYFKDSNFNTLDNITQDELNKYQILNTWISNNGVINNDTSVEQLSFLAQQCYSDLSVLINNSLYNQRKHDIARTLLWILENIVYPIRKLEFINENLRVNVNVYLLIYYCCNAIIKNNRRTFHKAIPILNELRNKVSTYNTWKVKDIFSYVDNIFNQNENMQDPI